MTQVLVEVGLAKILIESCANGCDSKELEFKFWENKPPSLPVIICNFCQEIASSGYDLQKTLDLWNRNQIEKRKETQAGA